MSIDQPNSLDAIGVDRESGAVVLTLMDAWDWSDALTHADALEAKLDAYFAFVESGEIFKSYPTAKNRRVVIDVVTRFPLPPLGKSIVDRAAVIGRSLGVLVKAREVAGKT